MIEKRLRNIMDDLWIRPQKNQLASEVSFEVGIWGTGSPNRANRGGYAGQYSRCMGVRKGRERRAYAAAIARQVGGSGTTGTSTASCTH